MNSQKDEVVVNSSNEFKDNQIRYNAIEIKSSQTNDTDPHGVSSFVSSFSKTIKPKRHYEHTEIPVHNDEIAMFKHPGNIKSASSQRNPGQPDVSADGDSHMVMIVVRPTIASSIRYNDPEALKTEENWNYMPIVVKVGNISRSNERSRASINESVHEKSPVVETLTDIEPQMKESSKLQSIFHDFILYGPKILKFHSKDIEIKRCHTEVMSQREQRFICKTTGESKFKLEKVKFSSHTLNSGKSSKHTTENTSLFPTSVRTEPVTSVNVHRQLIRENSTDVFDKPNNVMKVRPSSRPTSTTIEYSRDEDNAMVKNQYSSDSDTNNETMLNNFSNSQQTPGIIINPQLNTVKNDFDESYDALPMIPLNLNEMKNTSGNSSEHLKQVNTLIPVEFQPVATSNQSNMKFDNASNNPNVYLNTSKHSNLGKYNNSIGEVCINCTNNVSTFNDIQQNERRLNETRKTLHSTPVTNSVHINNEAEILNTITATSPDHIEIFNTTSSTLSSNFQTTKLFEYTPKMILNNDSKMNSRYRQISRPHPSNVTTLVNHDSPDVGAAAAAAAASTTTETDGIVGLSGIRDADRRVVNINQNDEEHQNLLSDINHKSSDDNSSLPKSNSLIKNIVHAGLHGVNIFKQLGRRLIGNEEKKVAI